MFSVLTLWGAILFGVLGVCFGSFANVVIGRLPHSQSIMGYSKCPWCKARLLARDLIPLCSWLGLRARCRHCREKISIQYPLVELASGLLFLAAYFHSSTYLAAAALSAALLTMLIIFMIDVQTQMIPDVLTIALAAASALYHWHLDTLTIAPALVGIIFFGTQWVVSKGRWVGSGDILLSGALGIFVGSVHLSILALLLSYIIGALCVSILLVLKKVNVNQHIAFGPFLIVGAILSFFVGENIMAFIWY